MSVSTRIQVIDGLYVVGYTTDGRDFDPAADGFKTPREACDFAYELEGHPTSRRAPDLASGSPLPSSQGLALGEAPEGRALSVPQPAEVGSTISAGTTCPGCGGPLPPGSRGQERKTCSAACRERLRYQRAANAPRPDADSTGPNLTPSQPSDAMELGL